MIARDGSTVFENVNIFGEKWQIFFSESTFFYNVKRPQTPVKCDIPLVSNLRRQFGESNISKEETEIVYTRISLQNFDIYVFHIMATENKNIVGIY